MVWKILKKKKKKTKIEVQAEDLRIRIEFGEWLQGETDRKLSWSEANIPQQRRNDFWIFFVTIKAKKPVYFFDYAPQLVIRILWGQLQFKHKSVNFVDADCNSHFLLEILKSNC